MVCGFGIGESGHNHSMDSVAYIIHYANGNVEMVTQYNDFAVEYCRRNPDRYWSEVSVYNSFASLDQESKV